MSVLVFRHVPYEHLGLIASVLEAAGLKYKYVDLPLDVDRRVDLESASGLVFMGGPMSVNDDLPYLRREIEIIREAAGKGLPILGVCLALNSLPRPSARVCTATR
jgi:GMP synthase-like glutamine amidotransferase